MDVGLDIKFNGNKPSVELDGFRNAIKTIGRFMSPGCLIIIETTIPPGTCEKIVAPELSSCLKSRGLQEDSFLLAHSYERVMPGKDYFDSIVNYWRVYAGYSPEAADACERFLSKVTNVESFPLTRLTSIRASEMGKILENSYRAVTIAFMEEWGRFAEAAGVDLFEVISAIRKRPTHSNIRQPGFGVGGYCLTKDPLFAEIAAHEIFKLPYLRFPFCNQAVAINKRMPLVSLDKIQNALGGDLLRKTILLFGVSYRPDVADTRHSPSQTFVENARKRGARVFCYDPLITFWPELDIVLPAKIPSPDKIDAVMFAVPHQEYKELDIRSWLNGNKPLIFDANNVLTKNQIKTFMESGCKVCGIGRGNNL